MEITIALALSILGAVISVINFALGRKDKAVKDTKEDESDRKLIEYRLNELSNKVDKIIEKLDNQEEKMKAIAKEEISNHILEFHKKEGK